MHAPAGEASVEDAGGELRREWLAWVPAARRGERAAFDRLHARFVRLVHGLLLARVPAREADDLAQEVFVSAWTRLGDLREDAAFPGWLAAITRRQAADAARRRPPSEPLSDELPATRQDPARAVEAARVLASIRELPEAYRETLLLRFAEGLTGPEIAELTGLTPGSVRVNLHRGMGLLRQRLGEGGAS